MKVMSLLAILLGLGAVAEARANSQCFARFGCRPYKERADARASNLELKQRGTVCLDAAESLPGYNNHECFEALDSAAIRLFNVASLREATRINEEQGRRMEEYRRQVDEHQRQVEEYRRQCETY